MVGLVIQGQSLEENSSGMTKALTVEEFTRLHTILRQLAPLLAVLGSRAAATSDYSAGRSCHSESSSPSMSSYPVGALPATAECTICCSLAEGAVLPCCRNGLCRECEMKWVREHLICPFCRALFVSLKHARCSSWELTTWPPDDLKAEIAQQEDQLVAFWRSFSERDCSVDLDLVAGPFVEVGRSLQIIEDGCPSGFVRVEKTDGKLHPPMLPCFRA
jgi:hypothetical protein